LRKEPFEQVPPGPGPLRSFDPFEEAGGQIRRGISLGGPPVNH
jgi:hypothetical protein